MDYVFPPIPTAIFLKYYDVKEFSLPMLLMARVTVKNEVTLMKPILQILFSYF